MPKHHAPAALPFLIALSAPISAQLQFDQLGQRIPAFAGEVRQFAVGDVDGDGDQDLVLAMGNHSAERNRLLLNDGLGWFADATTGRLPSEARLTRAAVLVDVDGDGDLDVVCANEAAPNSLYLNDGAGQFRDVGRTHMPGRTDVSQSIVATDVDADGDPDLVFGNAWKQDTLYLNDGSGSFRDATASHMPVDASPSLSLAVGDVDADGDPDLLLDGNRSNRLYLNDGLGRFTDVTATHMPVISGVESTYGIQLGDLDADGDLDVVFANFWCGYCAVPNRLYLNSGSGRFADATATHLSLERNHTQDAAVYDVDGDEDLDIVFAKSSNELWENDGHGHFTNVSSTRMPKRSGFRWAIALADVDGDGDPDLIDGGVRVDLNLLRQIDTSASPGIGTHWTLDVWARPSTTGTSALPFVSAMRASIPLPPIGTVGIDPTAAIALPPVPISSGAGVGKLTFTVPNSPNLVDARVYTQVLLLPVTPPSAGRLTNTAQSLITK